METQANFVPNNPTFAVKCSCAFKVLVVIQGLEIKFVVVVIQIARSGITLIGISRVNVGLVGNSDFGFRFLGLPESGIPLPKTEFRNFPAEKTRKFMAGIGSV